MAPVREVHVVLVFLATVLLSACAAAKKTYTMPKEFSVCRKKDPQVDECLKDAIQKAIPVLVKGLPRYGLLSVDPLLTTRVGLIQHGPVDIVLNMTNFDTEGMGKVRINRVKSDIANYQLRVDLNIPGPVYMKGGYGINGTVFILPIQGQGDFTFILDNCTARLHLAGETRLRGGVDYMNVKHFGVDLKMDKLTMDLTNLFGGNTELGKYANEFINTFSAEIYENMKPIVEQTAGLIFRELSNRFFDKVPYKQVFV